MVATCVHFIALLISFRSFSSIGDVKNPFFECNKIIHSAFLSTAFSVCGFLRMLYTVNLYIRFGKLFSLNRIAISYIIKACYSEYIFSYKQRLYNAYAALYNVHLALYNVYPTLYNVYPALCNVHPALYNIFRLCAYCCLINLSK